MDPNHAMQVEIEHRFKETSPIDDKIDRKEGKKILEKLYDSVPYLEEIMAPYTKDYQLREDQKTLTLNELLQIAYELDDDVKKITVKAPFYFPRTTHAISVESHFNGDKRPTKIVETLVPNSSTCAVQIHQKNVFEIIPFELALLKKIKNREGIVLDLLTREQSIAPYYMFNHRVYSEVLRVLEIDALPKGVKFLYLVISFRWGDALDVLFHEFNGSSEAKQFINLFEDLSKIEETMSGKKSYEYYFKGKISFDTPPFKESSEENHINKLILINDKLNNIYSTFDEIYELFNDPYLKAAAHFLSIHTKNSQPSYVMICSDESLSTFIRLLIARSYLNRQNYDRFIVGVKEKIEKEARLEDILYVSQEAEKFSKIEPIITKHFDEQPQDYERNCLACLTILLKIFDFKDQEFRAVENDQHLKISPHVYQKMDYLISLVGEYEKYLRMLKDHNIYKEYTVKRLNIPKSIIQSKALKTRPQCVYQFFSNDKNHFRTFTTQFEVILNQRKTKSSYINTGNSNSTSNVSKVASNKSMIEVMDLGNTIESHCAICGQAIETFNPNQYVNGEIKSSENEKFDSPCLYLTQSFENALVWCPFCNHGGHLEHLENWFASITICPIKGCKCYCKF